MYQRVCSLETEYALVSNLLTQSSLGRENLADLIEEIVLAGHLWARCNSFERRSVRAGGDLVKIREGQFIENGSRVYYDAGHFEWANPETLDPYGGVLYDKAAELDLSQAMAEVNAQLQTTFPGGWAMLAKNNIDYYSDASYGCHENYSLRRYDDRGQDIFARLAEDLVPFLVTRQIFCGAGRIGARVADPDDPVAFQLSQRADFIRLLQSPNPREERGILNLRDEPLAEAGHWRRLHLILGDSNMAEFAMFLKLGTTSLVLDLVEAGLVAGRWALRDPVGALHQVSRDWRGAQLPLRSGGQATALSIQRGYWRLARHMASGLPATHFAHRVIERWAQTLYDLEQDGPRLRQRLDWAIKQHYLFQGALQAAGTDWEELGRWAYVIERTKDILSPPDQELDVESWFRRKLSRSDYRHLAHYVRTRGLDWRFYADRRRLLNRLREMDFRYHDINPDKGLYALIAGEEGQIERLIAEEEVQAARQRPPGDTRACQRGQIIRLCHERGLGVEMDWDKVLLIGSNRKLPMADPFLTEPINLALIPEFGPAQLQVAKPSPAKPVDIKIISVEDLKKD